MQDERINKAIFTWGQGMACKNWQSRVRSKCMELAITLADRATDSILTELGEKIMAEVKRSWSEDINKIEGKRNKGLNKLRTYRTFKSIFETEEYVKVIMPRSHRSAYAQFRCGVAPIRLETGRYEGLEERERLCPFCQDVVESELHVLVECPFYADLRENLFKHITLHCPGF